MQRLCNYKIISYWKTKQGKWLQEAEFYAQDPTIYIPTENKKYIAFKLKKPVIQEFTDPLHRTYKNHVIAI